MRRLRSAAAPAGSVAWTLTPGSPSISTRFLSVQIAGRVSGLFDVEPPRLRVEVREGKAVVSRPVASSYGFEEATGSVQMAFAEEAGSLRPNTVTLMLEQVPKAKTVDLVLVDAGTDRVLATAAGVPVTIAAF